VHPNLRALLEHLDVASPARQVVGALVDVPEQDWPATITALIPAILAGRATPEDGDVD
jgi:hypothetical protein